MCNIQQFVWRVEAEAEASFTGSSVVTFHYTFEGFLSLNVKHCYEFIVAYSHL